LKEKYPELKPHELKLCAYLRLNLSSKEIAHLMSISVRGVEISRYRLRKNFSYPQKQIFSNSYLILKKKIEKNKIQLIKTSGNYLILKLNQFVDRG